MTSSPVALSDTQMRAVRAAAETVPYDLRTLYLQRVADLLRDKPLGDGVVHRVCRAVAHQILWDAARSATG